LPEYLEEFIGTENIKTTKEGYYEFHPKAINNHSLTGISLASIKYNHKRIKNLENKVEELTETIEYLIQELNTIKRGI
jgi:hypothetical protein